MVNRERVRRGYDQVAGRYAEKRDQASSVPFLERLDSHLAPNSLVLDLGCGAGLPVDRWLVDQGHRVIGLDISEGMLALARRNVPEATYRQRDMAELAEGAFSVDAVVSFFALFHVERTLHRALLRRVRSYLPEGGLLMFTTGTSDWEGEEDFLGVPMQWSHYDGASYRSLLEESGFTVLLEDRHRGNPVRGKVSWHAIYLARAQAPASAER